MLGDVADALLAVLEKINDRDPKRMRHRLGNLRLPLEQQGFVLSIIMIRKLPDTCADNMSHVVIYSHSFAGVNRIILAVRHVFEQADRQLESAHLASRYELGAESSW